MITALSPSVAAIRIPTVLEPFRVLNAVTTPGTSANAAVPGSCTSTSSPTRSAFHSNLCTTAP
jgi:hypothetical protein